MSKRRKLQENNSSVNSRVGDEPSFKIREVCRTSQRFNERFKRFKHTCSFELKHNFQLFVNFLEVGESIDSEYRNFLSTHIQQASDNDRIIISISHDDLQSDVFHSFFKKKYFFSIFFEQYL